MRHKDLTPEDFIRAGACYRLLKTIAAYSTDEIARSLDLTARETDQLAKAYNQICKLETLIGFERILNANCNKPGFEYFTLSNFTSVFYGAISFSECYPPMEIKIQKEVKEILPQILKMKEED